MVIDNIDMTYLSNVQLEIRVKNEMQIIKTDKGNESNNVRERLRMLGNMVSCSLPPEVSLPYSLMVPTLVIDTSQDKIRLK